METKRNKMEEGAEDEINLLDILIVLAKRKRMIIAITLTAAILTAVYSLFMPRIYKAETRIFSSGKSDASSSMINELTSVMGINTGVKGLADPSVIIDIIKSKTVYNGIIDRFGLMEIYGTESREVAQKKLEKSLSVNKKRSSIIIISVLNRDRQLATDIANAFVEELTKHLKSVALTDASRRRLFFEDQLKQAKEQLIQSEEALKAFQEETGVMKIDEQANLVMRSIADLRAQVAAKEVELKVMKLYSTANNPDLQITEETVKGLKDELQKLEKKGGNNPSPLIPTGRMPNVSVSYIRKLRDLRFNESILEIMAKQYEMARLDEANDSAIIQVIDKAVPPEESFKPRRKTLVMISAVVSFFFSLFLAFILEYVQNLQTADNENRERINALRKYITFKRIT